MNTQAQAVSTQDQPMTTQEIQEVGPRVNQNASIMSSCLSDFNRMNPPMLFVSKVKKNPILS